MPDRVIGTGPDAEVIQAIREYKREAETARRTRMRKNRENFDAYLGYQDWSHKIKGQSREFLPKVPMAIEQLAAFIKRGLVAFSEWFTVETPPGPLGPHEIRKLLTHHLDCLKPDDFSTVISEAVKLGALGSLMILKIHGRRAAEPVYSVESGLRVATIEGREEPEAVDRLARSERTVWRLLVDLVPPEDYYPDPRGARLYEIHEVERDVAEVQGWVEDGIYDPTVFDEIEADFARQEEEWLKARRSGHDVATPPSFRKRLVLQECWGTLLKPSGRVLSRNVVATLANDRYLLRPPQPNPNWHGETPFVSAPLVRVPLSVWHKALADHMTPLNFALNELFNLILDGGLASVWGVRQVRPGWLEDPGQVSDGIPQGATLAIKDEAPVGAKVVETVTTSEVPQAAVAVYGIADRGFQEASMTNDLKLGLFPPRAVKATEVVEAAQSQALTLDATISDVERGLVQPSLKKAWLTILQFADDLPTDETVAAIGPRAAVALARMSPAQRFATFAGGCKFKVTGLSGTLARARDFQKLMAAMQAVSLNPVLLQAFFRRFSADKVLTHIFRALNIDPTTMEQDEAEREGLPQMLKELPFFQGLTRGSQGGGGGAGAQPSAQEAGGPSMPAEIGQMNANPMGGGVG